MNWVLVENGEVKKIGLPKTGFLKDGSSVSGYVLLDEEVLRTEGWLPLEDSQPEYNHETEYLQNEGYEVLEDKVTVKYLICTIENPSLDELKKAKVNEVSSQCNAEILAGFESEAKNGLNHYSFEYEDQINMLGMFTAVTIGGQPFIEWKNSSQLICDIWTAEEFLHLYNDGMTFKTDRVRRFNQLTVDIINAESKEELELIQW